MPYVTIPGAKFPMGQLVMTNGVKHSGVAINDLFQLLTRHAVGDWGDMDDEDKRTNDEALNSGNRLLSAYQVTPELKLWIITEADRSVTTVLLPDEY